MINIPFFFPSLDITDLKNKKASLETSVQRAQRDVDKLAEPQTRLHGELRERRVEALEQLKNQSEDVKKIETEIFSSGQRLGAVLKENHRYNNKPTLGANKGGISVSLH